MSGKAEDLVDDFFGDPSVQRLVTSSASCNPLRICYPKEVNVSRFIAWLLDPSEGHGLGDQAIRSLLVRAWHDGKEATIPLPTRRFLSPSNVLTEGFSASLVTTEVALDGRSLDVLMIDDAGRNYIAIENKFGAQQSSAQLSHYRKHLEKLFPDFTGVHIFLDSRMKAPEDPAWISIGYDWLSEFLMEAEQRESIAAHVREAFAQFRDVIEDESKDAMIKSAYGRLVTDVACKHPYILGLMRDWSVSSSKGMRAGHLAELMQGRSTLEGRAMLRLFQLYWSRTRVWDDCIRQVQFGPFVSKLRDRFPDLLVSPKIVRSGFSLERWESLIDRQELNEWFSPAGVTVAQTGDSFRVVTFINLSSVRGEKTDQLREIAARAKSSSGRNGNVSHEQAFIRLRVQNGLTLTRAVDEALSEMLKLDQRLATVH